MPTIGTTTKPNGGWHSYSGSSETNQEAEVLTMPAAVRITELAQWMGGWNGSCRAWLAIWDATSKAFLGSTGQINVANEGAGGPAGSNVALYQGALTAPVDLPAGAQVLVGFVRHQSDGHQVSVGGAGSGSHWHGRSGPTFPNQEFGHGDISNPTARVGAYIANYEPRVGAWIRRGTAWVQAEAVYIRRGAAWVEATEVQLRRGAGWTDAS